MIVFAVVDDAFSPDSPLGRRPRGFIRGEDSERFVEEARGDDPEVAAKLRIEERELEPGAESPSSGHPRVAPSCERCGSWSSSLAHGGYAFDELAMIEDVT